MDDYNEELRKEMLAYAVLKLTEDGYEELPIAMFFNINISEVQEILNKT